MNVHELFPSRYLRPSDLGDQEYPVTMAGVRLEEVHLARTGRSEDMPVLYYERARKGLILSAHNAHTIAALYGPETEAWPGRRITLHLERGVEAFGRRYDVVRVRPQAPAAATPGEEAAVLADPDEVEAGLADGEEDEAELEAAGNGTMVAGSAVGVGGLQVAGAGRGAGGSVQGHWTAAGAGGAARPAATAAGGEPEAAARTRQECLRLIGGFAEDERVELCRALDGLTGVEELRRFRRWLHDEQEEARTETAAAGRGGGARASASAATRGAGGAAAPRTHRTWR